MNFCQYFRPISISLSPNTEKDDVLLAFKLLFQPWRWQKSRVVKNSSRPLEEEFKRYLGTKYAVSFNSGRSALMAILDSLWLERGSEILLQAFTCNAAPNPVIWTDFKPIYVDCDENTFNIDINDLRRKITPKSKAVIVQHTFGLPAEMDEIVKICQEHNLILIEDCAHALGAEYQGRKVGTFGKAAFFSFSRDKIISSVYGGMAVTDDELLAQKLKKYMMDIGYPSHFWVFQQLLHPVLMNWLISPTYKYFGKYLFVLFQELNILSKAVHWKEKRGLKPGYFPKRMPNALEILALNQFKKLKRFNEHRKKITAFYAEELSNTKYQIPDTKYNNGHVFLRFSVRHSNAHRIIREAWSRNILIGDWYTTPIAPDYNKLEKIKHGKSLRLTSENMGYKLGSCPMAEKLAKETLNLPTHINISKEEARKIVEFLKLWK